MTGIWVLSVFFLAGSASGASDTETLKRLERLITQQQTQIEAQAKAIEDLKQQVQKLSKPSEQMATEAVQAVVKKEKVVTNTSDKVSVQLYGQVNRGVLYSNDGNDGYLYHVDNDNSSTRVGLFGLTRTTNDITAATRIEVEFQANDSNKVNQNDQYNVGDNHFRKRILEVLVEHKKYGILSLGYGRTASDGSSEVDLSGTSVVGYSSIADMAGGQLFYDTDLKALSTTDIGDVFSNMDGLSRTDRIRYDTPKIYGFIASASNISGGANDVALRYSAKLGDFKLAAAAAYADYGGISSSIDNQLNGSISTRHSSGFNLTFAAGTREIYTAGRNDGSFYYGKVGYRRKFFPVGITAMSLDYGRFEEIQANNDKADTFGAMLVQNFVKWGMEYYLGYRNHDLDRTSANFKSIDAILTGLRVKF